MSRSSFVSSEGVPDEDFGWYGMVTTSLTAEGGFGRAVAMQADGKLVVAGSIGFANKLNKLA